MSLLEHGLAGKVAVVTGAGQGIGAGVARALAAIGVKVAILDLESQRELATAVSSRTLMHCLAVLLQMCVSLSVAVNGARLAWRAVAIVPLSFLVPLLQ